MRHTVLQTVLKTSLQDQLGDGAKKSLGTISDEFKKRNLPHPVRLGLVGTPGVSLSGHSIDRVQKILETYIPRTLRMGEAAMRLWENSSAPAGESLEEALANLDPDQRRAIEALVRQMRSSTQDDAKGNATS